MIRYVLVIAVTATVLGTTATALDHASTVRGERALEAEIATIEHAAVSLVEEEPPPTGPGTPRRTVTLSLPTDGIAIDGAEQVRFEPVPADGVTRVRYRVAGGREATVVLDVLITGSGGGPFELTDRRGSMRVRLSLRTRDGDRVVEAAHR